MRYSTVRPQPPEPLAGWHPRLFRQVVRWERRRLVWSQRPSTLVVLRIHDGPSASGEPLRSLTATACQHLRGSDVICAIPPSTLLVLYLDTGPAGASMAVRRLQEKFSVTCGTAATQVEMARCLPITPLAWS
ncbi:MAG: hypothetical protein IMX01_04815 [Limnochordaceae bacterium]|nr:hypothetical protein [Limnochordaceae bacterium]